jgi:iron(II)-dependent oxidoreductase
MWKERSTALRPDVSERSRRSRRRETVAAIVACLVAAGAGVSARLDAADANRAGDRVVVPAGWFEMGSDAGGPDERPVRRVYLDAYEIDRFEVTNAEYRAFVLSTGIAAPRYWTGRDYPAGTGTEPVVGVGWRDACAYCAWTGGRLPTEAEWERACRGGEGSTYPWGDVWAPSRANVEAAPSATHVEDAWGLLVVEALGAPGLRPVGSLPSDESACGVSDMAGNASEWVADWYDPNAYAGLPARDPVGAGPEWNHVVRGGAWLVLGAPAETSRCSARNASHSYDDPRVGFRCARGVGAPLATPPCTG